MLIWFEAKKYILAYKKFALWLVAASIACFLLYLGAGVLLDRDSLFEPFSIGIVDSGDSPEIRYVFDIFDGIIGIEYLSIDEAREMLARGDIPAYAVLPEGFAQDILYGRNKPFALHGNREYPLRLALTRLLASGAVAFLSSSQSGIYATLDFAEEQGLSYSFIDTYILVPINVAYVRYLLEYDNFYSHQIIPLADGDPLLYFTIVFAAFLLVVGLLAFNKSINEYTPAIYARYRLAGWSRLKINCFRLLGLFIVYGAIISALFLTIAAMTEWMTLPAAFARGLALGACISAFGLAGASMFNNEAACGIFILMSSFIMLVVSGGVIPLAFIPRGVHWLRFLSIPYWAAEQYTIGTLALIGFSVVYFGVAFYVQVFRSRFFSKA